MSLEELTDSGARRALAPEPGLNSGFEELRPARFLVPPGAWDLFVDDAPLPRDDSEHGPAWLWEPTFYAGTVRGELVRSGDTSGTGYLFDVSPDPTKLGQAAYKEMVGEILAFDPDLVLGHQAATTLIGSEGSREKLSIRYMRLATHAHALIAAAARLSQEPHRTLRATRRDVPLHGVRSIDAQTIRRSITTAHCALLAEVTGDIGAPLHAPPQGLFDVQFSQETFDSAANRTIAALLGAIVRRASETMQDLKEEADTEVDLDLKRDLQQRLARRLELLDRLRASIVTLLRRRPLDAITRPEISAAGLTAIAAHPLYSRVQQLAWRMIRPGFEAGVLSESASMSPTWGVYEAWCFVSLVEGLRSRYADWTWKVSRRNGTYEAVGISGSDSIGLFFQQSFSYRAPPPKSGFWSISTKLIPDIVILMTLSNVSRWISLDAKYRRKRANILDAMRSAHLYRDALRWQNQQPSLSLLLTPSKAEAEWIQDLQFIRQHRVGAVTLSPSSAGLQILDALLAV